MLVDIFGNLKFSKTKVKVNMDLALQIWNVSVPNLLQAGTILHKWDEVFNEIEYYSI